MVVNLRKSLDKSQPIKCNKITLGQQGAKALTVNIYGLRTVALSHLNENQKANCQLELLAVVKLRFPRPAKYYPLTMNSWFSLFPDHRIMDGWHINLLT